MAKLTNSKDTASLIFEDMAAKILRLDLEPGSPVSESDICSTYNTSRTPAKTVLNRLSDGGYIDLLPYQQSRVRYINADETLQYLYGRVAIESRMIRDFISLKDPLLLEDVNHVIRKQEILASQDTVDLLAFNDLDVQLHEIWFRTLDKMEIWHYFRNSIDYTRMKILDYKREQDYDVIISEHKALAAAIAASDIEKVNSVLEQHVYTHVAKLIDKCMKDNREYFI